MKSEALGYKADVGKKPDLREAFSMGPLDVSERYGAYLRDSEMFQFFYQETPWPSGMEEFRETLSEFYRLSSALGQVLLRVMAAALGLPESHFQKPSANGEHCNSTRAILYPKLNKPAVSGQSRCGAHSDTGALTLLWSDTPGLELQSRDSRWLSVQNLLKKEGSEAADTNTLIVNIGHLLQKISQGKWRSTPHRVPAPGIHDNVINQDRIVLVNFIMLAPDFVIDPTTGMTQGEYAFSHFNRKGRNVKKQDQTNEGKQHFNLRRGDSKEEKIKQQQTNQCGPEMTNNKNNNQNLAGRLEHEKHDDTQVCRLLCSSCVCL
mmetsp:Transcript_10318/g.18829  ORF Transcript_10318/g.18829 Transcript_10318/m.18829 type:complete len:320 (-) Transcript_10318:295-1254(-)